MRFKLGLTNNDSFDASKHDNVENVEFTIEEFAQQIVKTGWVTYHTIDGKKRKLKDDTTQQVVNFKSSQIVALDFDNGTPTVKEAEKIYGKYNHIIGTTRHHQTNKEESAPCDRFRVLLFLEEEIHTWEQYEKLARFYKAKCCDDAAAHPVARLFFRCVEVVSVKSDGLFISAAPKNFTQFNYVDKIKAPRGERNNQASYVAKILRNDLKSQFENEDRAFQIFKMWNHMNCKPQLPNFELEEVWSNSIKYIDKNKTDSKVLDKAEEIVPISAAERRLRASHKQKVRLQTKMYLLPELSVFLYRQESSIIGASSKFGKSTLAANIAGNLIKQGVSVCYMTNELDPDDICAKIEGVLGQEKFDEAWDAKKLVVLGAGSGVDVYNIDKVEAFIIKNLPKFGVIILDQISKLTPKGKKFEDYPQFLMRVDNAQKMLPMEKCAHFMFVQQLSSNANSVMTSNTPDYWNMQEILGEARGTITQVQFGILYRRIKKSQHANLVIDAIRFKSSVPDQINDCCTVWLCDEKESLSKVSEWDSL